MIDGRAGEPIILHGILPRSGTNFLWDLLLLHPGCARPREPINEDFFLEHSDHLMAFASAVREYWDPIWGTFGADVPDRLYASIGDGLLSFLRVDPTRRLVTKSPSVHHLDRFFTFFPGARLVILVRDGRSVAQSAMTTFGWSLERAARDWAAAARTIRRFTEAEAARADRWTIVRYEALVDDPDTELRALFAFLGLDPARYDFEAARNLPVRGSSAFGRGQAGDVHWTPVARDASFAPKERWRSWSPGRLARFDWIAGDELAALGYAETKPRVGAARRLVHTVRDWQWRVATTARVLVYRLRGRLALRTRIRRAIGTLAGRTAR